MRLREWFDNLAREGPAFGYDMKLSKTVALVKQGREEEFDRLFEGLTDPTKGGLRTIVAGPSMQGGLKLGQRYLGVGVGTPGFRRENVEGKVENWVQTLRFLSKMAKVHPHEAYCILTKSLIPSWRYIIGDAEEGCPPVAARRPCDPGPL